ncbi:MAG: tRNA (adenosine(37)-N6)-threonylcarbamoyltransferase complex dimerization subunit type 1 TsaB [Terriglobia bacterium]
MWLLAVDTSSKDTSVALVRDGQLVVVVAPQSGAKQHSVQLFRNIRQALAEAGLALGELDVYAAANGPGAFTALRVGLTVVKGLAEMHDKPVVAVSVLEAVAESAQADGLLVPIVDAYRGQIFGGLYEKCDGELRRRGRERVLTLEEFLATLAAEGIQAEECTLAGPQIEHWTAQLGRSRFAASQRERISPVLAEAVARRAQTKFARGEILDALRLEANYVRRSDAELLWKRK